MNYLLDVNALVAWRHGRSPFHTRFHAWAHAIGHKNLTTCAIAELGFVRVSMQVFGYTLGEAEEALAKMKSQIGNFVETAPSPQLPSWVSSHKSTTDGYLTQIAAESGCRLATFDKEIKATTVDHIP